MYAQLAIKRLEEIKPLIDVKESACEISETAVGTREEKSAQRIPPESICTTATFSANLSHFSEEVTRNVNIHEEMLFVFESIAKKNTKHNKETCGVLAGVLKDHVLVVTSLIIPKQTGMSDSCEMLSEEELFALQVSFKTHFSILFQRNMLFRFG